MLQYRPEIDGLRAVAVSLVVLYHAGLPFISGGFVGVDIFFVISGYLITSVIISELKQGTFSFRNFYERRVRRLLPALYVMAGVTFLGSFVLYTPIELANASSAMLAALFFSSNIYFWKTTNYFSDSSEFQPYLHTWSLGVEEQFYFFFPVAIVLLFRRRAWLTAFTLAALCLSLALSIYATKNYAWAGYYLLPSRAWQMLAGAILAIYPIKFEKTSSVKVALALISFCCLLLPPFILDDSVPFPGLAAIPSTVGACLLIVLGLGEPVFLTRILSTRPMIFLGLISYSLYLWHWPVFAFIRSFKADTDLVLLESLSGICIAVLLGWLSWKYVENPFRNKKKFTSKQLYTCIGAGSFVLCSVFAATIALKGIPSRLDERVIEYASTNGDHILSDPCIHKEAENIRKGDICAFKYDEAPPSVILWGDSHAASFKPGYMALLKDLGISGYFAGGVGCPPLPGILKTNFASGPRCLAANEATLDYILNNQELTKVILHARWALSVEGSRYGAEGGKEYILTDTLADNGNTSTNYEHVSSSLKRLVETLTNAGKEVIIIGSIPEFGHNVPRIVANNLQWGKDKQIRPTISEFLKRQSRVTSLLNSLSEDYETTKIVFPHEVLCDAKACRAVDANANLLYLDDDHVSEVGALEVAQLIKAFL